MDKIISETFGLLALIIGVAILAVIVSRNSQTATVLTAASNAFSGALGTALSPIGGSAVNIGRGAGIGYGVN